MGSDSLDALRLVLKLLWCHSENEQIYFASIWKEIQEIAATTSKSDIKSISEPIKGEPLPEPPKPSEESPQSQQEISPPQPEETPRLTPLPVKSPYTPIDLENPPEFQVYLPVSRRSMAYTWRYLRRPMADGPADVLDVEATVEQATRQGFFLAPVYRRREVNHACLLLLIDQDGSMTPFHRFNRDLVETVEEDSTLSEIQIYYFHNVPTDRVYRDSHLTQPVSTEQVLAGCDLDTSVLIVSDAGAARGDRRMERIRATIEFLVKLKQQTSLIGWLNPMPHRTPWRGYVCGSNCLSRANAADG